MADLSKRAYVREIVVKVIYDGEQYDTEEEIEKDSEAFKTKLKEVISSDGILNGRRWHVELGLLTYTQRNKHFTDMEDENNND